MLTFWSTKLWSWPAPSFQTFDPMSAAFLKIAIDGQYGVFHCCHCNQKWDFCSFVVDLLPGCFRFNSSGKQGLERGGGEGYSVPPQILHIFNFFNQGYITGHNILMV